MKSRRRNEQLIKALAAANILIASSQILAKGANYEAAGEGSMNAAEIDLAEINPEHNAGCGNGGCNNGGCGGGGGGGGGQHLY